LSLIAEGIYSEESLPADPVAALEEMGQVSRECPYLRERNGEFLCNLLGEDSPVSPEMARKWLAIGEGCNSPLNSDRAAKLQADTEARNHAIDKISTRKRESVKRYKDNGQGA
jgi:hypothetical protein